MRGQRFLYCGSREPTLARVDARLESEPLCDNDTILEECSISRIQLLELCLGEGSLEGVSCLGSWRVFAAGMRVCVSVCMCTCFFMGLIFSCSCGPAFGEPPGEKEKAQNAMTPDGKYYALVNEADVSALTLAFSSNQTPTGENEPHMGTVGLLTPP